MKRCKVDTILNAAQNLISDHHRVTELLAAMNYPVPNRVNISHTVHRSNARFIRDNPTQNHVHCSASISDWRSGTLWRVALVGEGNNGCSANAFDDAMRDTHVGVLFDALKIRGDQLKFNRRAAAVEYQDVHRLS